MPRVPQFQPGQIGPVRTTGERFQAPSGPGAAGILAEGLAGAAKLLTQQDKINAENDETQARLAVAQARGQYAGAVDQFKGTKLGAARAGQADFDKGLDGIRDGVMKTATSPRMRQMIELGLAEVDSTARRMGASHAFTQSQDETRASFGIEQSALIDNAVSIALDNPAGKDRLGLQLRDSVRRQLEFDGWDLKQNPQALAVAEKAALAKMHGGVVDLMLSVRDPDIARIVGYEEAYRDEMTADLRSSILKRLQGPLQDREALADADHYMGLAPPVDAEAGPSAAPGSARLDAITEKSESAGNPNAVSPKGARGLMQVMPATARDPGFGIRPSDGTQTDDVRVGREYRAKMEQRYGGDLAKMWASYNWGPGNLDEAIAKHGDNWLDAAPRETKNYVRKNIAALGSAGASYAPQAREWSADAKQSAYAAIDRDVDTGTISPERAKRAKAQIDGRFRTDEGLLSDQRRAADDQAREIALKAGDDFKVSMLPKSVRDTLSPVDLAGYQAGERRVAEARSKAAAEDRGQTALWGLRAQARFDPESFKRRDLKEFIGVIPAGELNTLAMNQATERSKPAKNFSEIDYRGEIQSEINFQDKHNGLKLDDEQKVAMYDFMSGMLSQVYQKKGSVTKQDVASIFQSGMRQAPNAKGWFGKTSAPAYELLTDIPADFRQRFMSSWGANRPPTEGDVVSAYQQWVRAGRR